MRNKLLLLFTLVAFSASAQHQLSVQEAQTLGLQNNINVKNAKLDVSLAKKKVMETIAMGLPKINGEVNWQQFLEIPTTVVPANMFVPTAPEGQYTELQFGTEHNSTATLSASQLLFDGSYIVGLKASKIYSSLSQQSLQLTEQQIQDSIAAAYYNVLVAEQRKDFLQLIAEIHQGILDEVQARYDLGMVEDLDVDRMALTLSNMKIQSENMDRMTEVAYLYLKLILGIPLEETLVLSDSLPALLSQNQNLKIQEPNIENRLELQLAETQTRLMKLDLRRYQSQFLPSISAFGSYSENAFRDEFNFFDEGNWYPTKVIGLKATMNIFDGFSRVAKVQQAKIKLQQAKNNRAQVAESLSLAHKVALSNYLTALHTQKQKTENLELSKKIYLKTMAKYREGLVSSMELSQSGADYSQAQADNAQAIYNLLIAKTNYNRSVGN
ncbi:MAG: TolC family protein [Flavobacteriales bacterium]|jgi:outer membrane protein TolC|nr:TolC family protein [Flavobacteriales bacterium]|tara:strand:+ start:5483 stop:6802 length:1320 start_codon:yes stop_codon:yes gene_type:complete